MRRAVLLSAILGLALTLISQPTVVAQPGRPEGPRVVAALQRSGYVLFIRHAAEEGVDQVPVDLSDCGTQQRLTDEGRAQARAIGDALRALDIPVGSVLSSEYCPARDTALTAFADAEPFSPLTPVSQSDTAAREEQAVAIRELLAEAPAVGTNTVLVSHNGVLLPAKGEGVERAEAVIFEPDGRGGFSVLARVAWDEWGGLDQPW